ncbi:MAG: ATP-binding protein [Cellulosilyticum sp.]|nr:ATP-binding protein [Cellulosilyticum sp.]
MNFVETLKSAGLVLATGEVPLIVGESGIGKTALAKKLAKQNNWHLVVIDGNLLKEGEIGGLPTIESYSASDESNKEYLRKRTVYATHHKLQEIEDKVAEGKGVLLFIDEINRCEHTVQQELMNLILNREINGYKLSQNVSILAAMNPSSKYGSEFDYQVVDMDMAQENRFVWLYMESDATAWLNWAMETGIDEKVIGFISTFPEYLYQHNEEDVSATPRSYERVSKAYKVYKENKETLSRSIFFNVIKGNVGSVIAEEFINFIESDHSPLIGYEDVFGEVDEDDKLEERVKNETHTRLYLSAINIFKQLNKNLQEDACESAEIVDRLISFLEWYPVDLKIGLMREVKEAYSEIYKIAIENERFVEAYFKVYNAVRG